MPAKKALIVLMPVSSRGAPGSRGPVEGVSSAERSGGGGGRTAIGALGSEPTVSDFQAVIGPLARRERHLHAEGARVLGRDAHLHVVALRLLAAVEDHAS